MPDTIAGMAVVLSALGVTTKNVEQISEYLS
jgi:hypothetical protein